jgi:hypothetical protein
VGPRVPDRRAWLSSSTGEPSHRLRDNPTSNIRIAMRTGYIVGLLFLTTVADRLDAQVRPCQPAGPKAAELRTRAISIVTDSVWAEMRAALGVVPGDTAGLSVVTTDAVCDSVTRGVQLKSEAAPRATSLIVVRFQRFFAACSPEEEGIVAVYLLDGAYRLRQVITGT